MIKLPNLDPFLPKFAKMGKTQCLTDLPEVLGESLRGSLGGSLGGQRGEQKVEKKRFELLELRNRWRPVRGPSGIHPVSVWGHFRVVPRSIWVVLGSAWGCPGIVRLKKKLTVKIVTKIDPYLGRIPL